MTGGMPLKCISLSFSECKSLNTPHRATVAGGMPLKCISLSFPEYKSPNMPQLDPQISDNRPLSIS